MSAATATMNLPTFLGQMLLEHHVLPTNVKIIQDNATSHDEKCAKRLSLSPPPGSPRQEPRCRWRRALIREASDGKLSVPTRRGSPLPRGDVSDSKLLRDVQANATMGNNKPATSIDRRRSPLVKLDRKGSGYKLMKPVRRRSMGEMAACPELVSNDCCSPVAKSPKCRWQKLNWIGLSGADSKLFIPSRRISMEMHLSPFPDTRKRIGPATMA
jgi:hypothetical protein